MYVSSFGSLSTPAGKTKIFYRWVQMPDSKEADFLA